MAALRLAATALLLAAGAQAAVVKPATPMLGWSSWNRLKNEDAAAAAAEGGEVSAPPPPKPAAPRKPKAEKEEGSGAKPERASWSRAEDATIVHSVAELGHKWYLIAQRLPGRTDHAIRNRYHRLQAMRNDGTGALWEYEEGTLDLADA